MTSSPGLRGCSRLQAHRGVLQTTTDDDRRETAQQLNGPYTVYRWASNKAIHIYVIGYV